MAILARICATKPTVWLLVAMTATILAAISLDVTRCAQPAAALTEVPPCITADDLAASRYSLASDPCGRGAR